MRAHVTSAALHGSRNDERVSNSPRLFLRFLVRESAARAIYIYIYSGISWSISDSGFPRRCCSPGENTFAISRRPSIDLLSRVCLLATSFFESTYTRFCIKLLFQFCAIHNVCLKYWFRFQIFFFIKATLYQSGICFDFQWINVR